MVEQIKFDHSDFAMNPEPRCPCLLLLDVSGSMTGQPINELNVGLQAFFEELKSDELAMKRVEVGIITFGPVKVESYFMNTSFYPVPTLKAQGDTPMGAAISQGITMIEDRKAEYKSNGIQYYRPWIFLITDGEPTDYWQDAASAVKEGEASRKFAFFAVGVKGANMNTLSKISVRDPLLLDGLKFRELFSWLSSSLRSVSRSVPGAGIPLEVPKGWASV